MKVATLAVIVAAIFVVLAQVEIAAGAACSKEVVVLAAAVMLA